jgi:hypothetical protein
MLYELRIYTMYPQKLDAIEDRFSNHTLGIFQRLGMKVYDFWVDANHEPKLYYIMEYRDMEERNTFWTAFKQDTEWLDVKSKSEESGPIVKGIEEIFMQRADYFKLPKER